MSSHSLVESQPVTRQAVVQDFAMWFPDAAPDPDELSVSNLVTVMTNDDQLHLHGWSLPGARKPWVTVIPAGPSRTL
ncbi:hypothetical protein PENPOL_c011G09194 [Penicillium polonicum]|uniref:Uncharacterized protein n=1 Tax=Penicillium polonicum TaxID=60169 RepID=A0A1V6ND63_PENPO|nr:hypothetical protein PENPOL_c011G09194 [Penicillium polonicum]